MEIANGTSILIADGEKYLLLRNEGDEKYMNLAVLSHEHQSNPATHDQATDRTGRRTGGSQDDNQGISALEETDWHKVGKERFVAHVADLLNSRVANGSIGSLILVAGPDTLGQLREAIADKAGHSVVAEVGKDLTNHPLYKIEKILGAA